MTRCACPLDGEHIPEHDAACPPHGALAHDDPGHDAWVRIHNTEKEVLPITQTDRT